MSDFEDEGFIIDEVTLTDAEWAEAVHRWRASYRPRDVQVWPAEHEDGPEVICDGGGPLWPVRWNELRHGTYSYRVTVLAPEGAEVTIGPAGPTVTSAWYGLLSRRLCIDGREYSRRQRARVKRRRR